jgi:hypothetical protein
MWRMAYLELPLRSSTVLELLLACNTAVFDHTAAPSGWGGQLGVAV